jgi:hypothetical protein
MDIFNHDFGRRGRCLWEPWVRDLGLVGENYILSWWWGMGSTLLSNNTIPPPNVVLREEGREDSGKGWIAEKTTPPLPFCVSGCLNVGINFWGIQN